MQGAILFVFAKLFSCYLRLCDYGSVPGDRQKFILNSIRHLTPEKSKYLSLLLSLSYVCWGLGPPTSKQDDVKNDHRIRSFSDVKRLT